MYTYDTLKNPAANLPEPLLFTNFPAMRLMRRGKDKDIYDLGDTLLIVFSDRLSAAGKDLGQGVKGKGKIVSQFSAYWFRKLGKIFPNHLVSADERCFPEQVKNCIENLDGCSMLVWKTTPLPVRCVVRGYLAGAGWQEYQETGEVCGNKIPAGLVESQRLPTPIFTPTTKGMPGGKNENIPFGSLQQLLGESLAEKLRDASIRLYYNAWRIARQQQVLIADTKFEFGFNDGKLMLIDECLTPDTSRYWKLESHLPGGPVPSLDKQLMIDYLESLNNPDNIPQLSKDVLRIIGEKYNEANKRVVGERKSSRMKSPWLVSMRTSIK